MEGRSTSILCMWRGTWGGQRSFDKSVVFYVSRQGPWGHGRKTPVDTMRSYAKAIPSDKSSFCMFQPSLLFPLLYSERVLAAHWSLPASAPPPPPSVAFAAGVSVCDCAPLHLEAAMACTRWYLLSQEEKVGSCCALSEEMCQLQTRLFFMSWERVRQFLAVSSHFLKSEHFPSWMTPSTGIQTS